MFRLTRNIFFIKFLTGLCFFGMAQLCAQTQQSLDFRSRGAQYQIGRDDELLIKVNIWGLVRMPGQYIVPNHTDLISLISYAGGPSENAQTKSVKLIRTTKFTPDGKARNTDQKIYQYNIKKFLETGDLTMNPQLIPDDTILISGSAVHFLSKLLDFAEKLFIFVQIYLMMKIAGDR